MLLYKFGLVLYIATILMAKFYVYSLEEWKLRQPLLPCKKQLENVKFTKRVEAATKE